MNILFLFYLLSIDTCKCKWNKLNRIFFSFLQVQQSLDGVMEYLLNNTPLNWLVGPFAPQIAEKPEGNSTVEQAEMQK